MKRALVVFSMAFVMAMVVFSFAAEKGKLDLKVGEERYVCNCGEKCACKTISMNQGKCTCGNDMVKAKVVKVGRPVLRQRVGSKKGLSRRLESMPAMVPRIASVEQSVRIRANAPVAWK